MLVGFNECRIILADFTGPLHSLREVVTELLLGDRAVILVRTRQRHLHARLDELRLGVHEFGNRIREHFVVDLHVASELGDGLLIEALIEINFLVNLFNVFEHLGSEVVDERLLEESLARLLGLLGLSIGLSIDKGLDELVDLDEVFL